jgi:hypothetical protein
VTRKQVHEARIEASETLPPRSRQRRIGIEEQLLARPPPPLAQHPLDGKPDLDAVLLRIPTIGDGALCCLLLDEL